MKRILLLAFCLALLCACSGRDLTPSAAAETMRAVVLEKTGDTLLVEPCDDTGASLGADRYTVTPPQGSDAADVGDIVEIVHSGEVLLTYPAQFSKVESVKVVGHREKEQIANPMQTYESAEYPDFTVVNYPDDEDLSPDRFWLIAGKLAQLDYEAEGKEICFRIAKDDGSDISGVYEVFEEDALQEHTLADGTAVTVRWRATAAGPALAEWTRGGYAYSMYLPHSPMGMAGGLLPRFLEAKAQEH